MAKTAPVQFSLKSLLGFIALGAGLAWLTSGCEQVLSVYSLAYLLVGYGQVLFVTLLWHGLRSATDRGSHWPYGPRRSAWVGFWLSISAWLACVGVLALRRVEVAFFSPATFDWIIGIVALPMFTALLCQIPAAVINIATLVAHPRSFRDLPLTVLRLLNLASSVMGLPAFFLWVSL